MTNVLVVDDDFALAQVVGHVLRAEGFGASAVEGAVAGVRWLGRVERVDVLVADIDMPDMTGWELARLARKVNPQLRVVLMSGTDSALHAEAVRERVPAVVFVNKPFTHVQIAAAVRHALAGDPPEITGEFPALRSR